jgi:hypothetical protein
MTTLVRTHTEGAKFQDVLIGQDAKKLRQARQRIAWTCTDNLGMTKAEASAITEKFDGKSPLTVGPYTFEVIEP